MLFSDASIRQKFSVKVLKLYDMCALLVSFMVATLAVHYQTANLSLAQFFSVRFSLPNVLIIIGVVIIWHLCFIVFGLYHYKRLAPRWYEVGDIIKATVTGTMLLFALGFLFKIQIITPEYSRMSVLPYRMALVISPVFMSVFWFVSTASTILGRMIFRFILYQFRIRGRNLRYMLIIGTNATATKFAGKIIKRVGLGYSLVGFVDNKWVDQTKTDLKDKYPIIGFDNFEGFLRENIIDEVIVCLPVKAFYDAYSKIIDSCEEQGVIIRFLSDIFGTKRAKVRMEEFEDNSVITIYTGAMEGVPLQMKRYVDIALSGLAIVALLPVFLIIALVIKCSSPGPIFFSQERIGLSKRRFHLIKFRTMVPDAEKKIKELEKFNEMTGPVFKMKNDPRITPMGKFLRKTSLDELPQIFNVFKGDMSIVGPRPLPVRDYEGFDEDWHRRRFSVKPGITCIWQIAGRNNIPFDKWMELDMHYIDNWSLTLDFKIILMTIPAVLKGSGE